MEARLAANMSRADLAFAIRQVSNGEIKGTEGGVGNWERGKHRPSDGVIPAIAAATGKPIDFFYEQDEEPVGVGAEEDPSRMSNTGLDAFVSDLVDRVAEKLAEREREQA